MDDLNEETPETFDFADWFGNKGVPEESVDIYTRTDLVGEINRIQRAIEEHDRMNAVERSLGDEMDEEETRLAALLEEYAASKVTFYLKGLTQDERNTIRKEHEASRMGDEDFSVRCVAKSIVALKRLGQERTKARMSTSHVRKLHRQIGDGQMAQLFRTYQQVTSGVPTVDADFLLRRSGPEGTEES